MKIEFKNIFLLIGPDKLQNSNYHPPKDTKVWFPKRALVEFFTVHVKDQTGILHHSQDIILLNQRSWNDKRTFRVMLAIDMYSTCVWIEG